MGMKYASSGYFNENIDQYVQIHNPTKMIDGCYFEVNYDGKPFYVCPVMHARVGMFNGMGVKGVYNSFSFKGVFHDILYIQVLFSFL